MIGEYGALVCLRQCCKPPAVWPQPPAVHWGSGWIDHKVVEVLLLCVSEQGFTPQLQLQHPHYSSEWNARRVRCHRPSALSHMTLKSEHSVAYWFACVRYSKLWLAFATKPAPLHTSLNCVARKFSANCARINQRFLSTGTSLLLCQLKKLCLWKISFVLTLVSLYKNSSCQCQASDLSKLWRK